jgi:hypothetical protein
MGECATSHREFIFAPLHHFYATTLIYQQLVASCWESLPKPARISHDTDAHKGTTALFSHIRTSLASPSLRRAKNNIGQALGGAYRLLRSVFAFSHCFFKVSSPQGAEKSTQ